MTRIDDWLDVRNLPKRRFDSDLDGEALAYALVSYIARPAATPEAVVVALAEDFFAKCQPSCDEA